MQKFRIGDEVIVRSGKDKDRKGVIEKIDPKKRVALIPGINLYKKHVKGQAVRGGQKGGIYDIPRPLSFSKISLICPSCKKSTRVGFKTVSGEKIRFCRKCKKELKTEKSKSAKKVK